MDRGQLKEFCSARRAPPPEAAKGETEDAGVKEAESPSPDVEQDFLTKLNAVFWELIEQTPVTPSVTSVATPGVLELLPVLCVPHSVHHGCACCTVELVTVA